MSALVTIPHDVEFDVDQLTDTRQLLDALLELSRDVVRDETLRRARLEILRRLEQLNR